MYQGAHGWAALAVAALSGASCTVVGGAGTGGAGTTTSSTVTTSHSGGAGGATTTTTGMGGSGGTPITGRALFESTCQQGLLSECAPCHGDKATTDALFILGPDYYDSVTHWPNVVVDPSSLSVLLSYPGQNSHVGPNLTPDLRAKLTTWLELEAMLLPKTGGVAPPITPFKPYVDGAFNAIRLDPLGPDFVNSSITFNAELLPEGSPNPTLLRLSKLEVHPIKGVQIRIVHPLFTIYPTGAAPMPDVADSFSGLDQTFALGGPSLELGTGEVVLSGWVGESRLGIAFEKIEVVNVGSPGATCKNVAKFQAEVVPQLKQWQCASLCHGGTNLAAQQQMDLVALDAMPPDEACGQVRARITPGDPATSQILQVTDPSYMGMHGFKFMGNKNNYNAFKAAVSPWIIAEQ